jgi:hypothetical protein
MITFSILFRERAGFVKIKARSMRKAVSLAKAMGADRNLGAVRHELIEAHRLLGDYIECWKTYQHDLTKLRRA